MTQNKNLLEDGELKHQYGAGRTLLEVLAELEDDLKRNYETGTVQQRALANIAGLQGDLFSSYLILLWQGTLIGRSVILRSILENQGNILHVKGNDVRSKDYLDFAEKMHKQLKDRIEGNKTEEKDLKWSQSKSSQRVSKIDDTALRLYDTLSDFVHGNNVQDYMNTEELTSAYIEAIDSYFVGLFIGFMAELGIGLDMPDEKRKLVFDAIDKAGRLRPKDK
jgi:hypothetical protein